MKQNSMNKNSMNKIAMDKIGMNKGERGQILPLLALSMTLLLGLDALVVDFGLIYFSQNELTHRHKRRP